MPLKKKIPFQYLCRHQYHQGFCWIRVLAFSLPLPLTPLPDRRWWAGPWPTNGQPKGMERSKTYLRDHSQHSPELINSGEESQPAHTALGQVRDSLSKFCTWPHSLMKFQSYTTFCEKDSSVVVWLVTARMTCYFIFSVSCCHKVKHCPGWLLC